MLILLSLVGFTVYMAFERMDRVNRQVNVPTDEILETIEENGHLGQTLNAFGYTVLEANASGKITRWDEVAASIWGYTSSEVINQPIEILMAEKVKVGHSEKFHAAMERGTGTAREAACETARHKEGWLFPIQLEIRILSKDRVVALVRKLGN